MSDTGIEAAAPATRGERVFAQLRDRIAASDPAYSRLRLAGRAMLSLVLSGALLAALTYLVHPLPVAAYGLAVVISFVGSMAVREPSAWAQMQTRLLAGGVAVLSVFLASLLAPRPVVADIAFLAVIFAAVYVRKFGPRWFAIGMIGFMAYFMGDYLKPQPADIGWLAVAAAIALGSTHVVGNLLLRDDPERDFRRALGSMDSRINLILRHLLTTPDRLSRGRANPLPRELGRLRDVVLMAEGFLPQGDNGALAAEGAASELAIGLFELQLAVERLVWSMSVVAPPADLLVALLHRDAATLQTAAVAPEDEARARAARLLFRVLAARARLDAALATSPPPAFTPAPPAQPGGGARPATDDTAPAPRVPLALQRPIQVTLACAVALGCGLLLSPVRWYWAVITAFIVFNNTRSRADTAVRAMQRSIGTFGGLIAGTIVATLVHGQPVVSSAGILLLFFLAFYFIQVSYGLMIFLITIALALLYGLMGMFSPDLLLVRLEETVVGGLAGTAVAFIVFPNRTSTGVDAALGGYLSALHDLVAGARARLCGEPADADLMALSRTLDRRYVDLANAVRPLGGPWSVVTRFGQVRRKLLFFAGGVHWGRVLARGLAEGQGGGPDHEPIPVDLIDRLVADIEAGIARGREQGASLFEGRPPPLTAPSHPPDVLSRADEPALPFEAIAVLIGRATA